MNDSQIKEIMRRIDEVLFYQWDPIGVSDTPFARSEYSSYVNSIFKYVLEEDEEKIVNVLGKIETDSMGLKEFEEKNRKIAEILIDHKCAVEEGIS